MRKMRSNIALCRNPIAILTLCAGAGWLAPRSSPAEALDNKGREFIMAFMPNYDNTNVTELHLTSDVPTTVTVEYPVNAPTFSTTVNTSPGTITVVGVPNVAGSAWVPNATTNNAVRAFADEDFVCYMINRRSFSSDAALALPLDVLNAEYIVIDYDPVGYPTQFIVVAEFDNTTVTITPSVPLTGHPAAIPFDVPLNRGEGYYGTAFEPSGPLGSMTGTIIASDRRVAVTNGCQCTNIPDFVDYCDHIFEVAAPVQSWGESIPVANLPNRPQGSIYRAVASQDNTTVTLDGAPLAVLNRGQYHETASLPGNHLFAADAPFFVTQYMTGLSSPGAVSGDPSQGNMIPLDQYLEAYTFSTVGGNQFAEHFVTVIAENADLATIELDGVPIGAGAFSPIPGTGFSAAVLPIAEGAHTTASNGVHGITVEGYNEADSYLYPGGALFQFINPVGDSNAPVCSCNFFNGPPPGGSCTASDSRPSEDANGNGSLDPGEDLNGNGLIDDDTGVFFVALDPGAVNLTLTVDPFTPGDGSVSYAVSLTDPQMDGSGVIRVTDGAGNTCTVDVTLDSGVCSCDTEVNDDGFTNFDDVLCILDCVAGFASPPWCGPQGCSAGDVDCDGAVTLCDADITICQFGGGTDCCNTTTCGACCTSQYGCTLATGSHCTNPNVNGAYQGDGTTCSPPGPAATGSVCGCSCDGDINNDGEVNVVDRNCLLSCINGSPNMTFCGAAGCSQADVNCDGFADYCDDDILDCQFMGGGAACCQNVVCGACCVPGPQCTHATAGRCAVLPGMGEYQGDGTSCANTLCVDCVEDFDCDDPKPCTYDRCDVGGTNGCIFEPLTRYGDMNGSCVINLDDLLCPLDTFAGVWDSDACLDVNNQPATLDARDVFPCPGCLETAPHVYDCSQVDPENIGDGFVNLEEVLVIRDLFNGTLVVAEECACPQICFAAQIEAEKERSWFGVPTARRGEIATAWFTLVPQRRVVRAGEQLEVDVYLEGVADLRGYQIGLDVVGPGGNTLGLASIEVVTDRPDAAFGALQTVLAINVEAGRMANALPSGGVDVSKPGYLGTFRYLTERTTMGTYRISARYWDSSVRDSHSRAVRAEARDAIVLLTGAASHESRSGHVIADFVGSTGAR